MKTKPSTTSKSKQVSTRIPNDIYEEVIKICPSVSDFINEAIKEKLEAISNNQKNKKIGVLTVKGTPSGGANYAGRIMKAIANENVSSVAVIITTGIKQDDTVRNIVRDVNSIKQLVKSSGGELTKEIMVAVEVSF